ncbi:peptidyl-prolyl cis-trans isomerase [Candidatus Dependentiae bacterium]|nr:peptidyl-prolyl cis-trans isomerase [Candidatus Dependentiae bacterium]
MNFKNSVIISSLVLLSSCSWFKKEETMADGGSSKSGAALLSINGKPVMYENEYEAFYNDFVNSRQDIQQFLAMNPAARDEIRKGIFNELALQNLFHEWVKKEGLDRSADYMKDKKQKMEMLEKAMAMNAFQQDLMKQTTVAEDEAEKYYNENRDKLGYFRQAPFVKSQGGVRAESIAFDSEKTAQEFANKVKKGNFKQCAKEAKKKITDLGVVNMQSPADTAIKVQVSSMKEIPGVMVVKTSDKKFAVVHAMNKIEAEYAPFAQVKDSVKEVMLQMRLPEIFKQKVEDLKKQMHVVENTHFFESQKPEAAQTAMQPAEEHQEMPKAQHTSAA